MDQLVTQVVDGSMLIVVCTLLSVFKDLCVCGYLEAIMYFLLYK